MTDIQIRFCTVFRDEHFAVLVRAHRPGVDVDVWVKFLNGHFQSAIFQQPP